MNQREDSKSAGMGVEATEILARYRQIHDDVGLTGLYEVEVVECQRACLADVNLISYTKHGDTIGSVMERARSLLARRWSRPEGIRKSCWKAAWSSAGICFNQTSRTSTL